MNTVADINSECITLGGLPLDDARGFHSYWWESRTGLMSLFFIAPLLLVYEGGLLWIGSQPLSTQVAARNGAEVWLRQLLDTFGFGQYFLLPLVTCGILLAWHHLSHSPWRLRRKVLPGMLLESVVLALVLLMIVQIQRCAFQSIEACIPCATAAGGDTFESVTFREFAGKIISYCGAGLYEELLFRLILLSSLLGLLVMMGFRMVWGCVISVAVISLIFSLAHYQPIIASGDTFEWFSFIFRFLAGVFFSILFLLRGFGIAAGTHAIYNIFTLF